MSEMQINTENTIAVFMPEGFEGATIEHEILPCPFCGCEPHDIKDDRVYHPYKTDCLLSGMVLSLKLWNRRK